MGLLLGPAAIVTSQAEGLPACILSVLCTASLTCQLQPRRSEESELNHIPVPKALLNLAQVSIWLYHQLPGPLSRRVPFLDGRSRAFKQLGLFHLVHIVDQVG